MAAMDRREFLAAAACAGMSTAAFLAGCSGTDAQDAQPAREDVDAAGQDAPSGEAKPASAGGNAASAPRVKLDNSTPGGSLVYYVNGVSAQGLLAAFNALGFDAAGRTAVKLHMGEEGNAYYLSPDLVRPLVEQVGGTFVDTTVLYFKRSTPEGYRELAAQHGFTYAPVDILDEDGGIVLPVHGGVQLTQAEVGSHYREYDNFVSLAHFKGHGMAGFGGVFKNLAIGLATCPQKRIVHGANFDTGQPFLRRVAEAAKAVFDDLGPRMACVNVINNLSVDCDCDSHAAAPAMADIGIMASLDPVALDRACLDQIYLSDDPGRDQLIERIESRDGAYLLDYAEQLGIGSQTYELIEA